ncbi:MAG: response regulator, partial [Rhodospirillales bacterium]|nr:response regulator [Rhodospirillales bacterium]
MQERLQAICSTMRVLTIDEDLEVVNLVSAVLKDLKILTTWTASDGNGGLDIFHQVRNQVDLIICDWMMPPGMNGLEILREVREVNSSVLFVLVSAKITPKAVMLAK